MYFSLFLVFAFAAQLKGLHVHGPSGPVTVQLGGTVLLPCLTQTPVSLKDLQVEWRKMDSKSLVNYYQQGNSRTEIQSPSFRGRAAFFPDEISKGNFSILLKNVVRKDAGVYKCKLKTPQDSGETLVEIKPIDHLTGADQVIFASSGEEVLLKCSVSSHLSGHELDKVIWTKKDGEILAMFVQDNETLGASHRSYQGRAEFFLTETRKGNFSLKLKNVRVEDEGEFICEVHAGSISTRTIVVLQSVGFSVLHVTILLLCLATLLITLGFSFPSLSLLRKKVANSMGLMVHATLMICPNMLMCVAYVLWSKEGFLHEAVICSVVSMTRPIMLMKTSPYLNLLPDCLQKQVKTVAVPFYCFVITVATFSVFSASAFDSMSKAQEIQEVKQTVIVVATLVYYLSAVISVMCLPFHRLHFPLLLEIFNGLLLARFSLFSYTTGADLDLCLQVISVLPHLLVAMTIVLFVYHRFQLKHFHRFHIALSFMVILYILVDICIYVVIKVNMIDFAKAWILLLEAVVFTSAWLAVIFLLRFRREKFCFLEKVKKHWCGSITLVLITVFGAACLHYTAKLTKNKEERAGCMALTILIHVLATTTLFKHPKRLPDLLHIIIYMFGAVGLTVINSITLASELILKAVTGARATEDLRLIVIPFETLFVSGWLALQIYDAWWRANERAELN